MLASHTLTPDSGAAIVGSRFSSSHMLMNAMNGQIPRGLVTREGTPVQPTARLPSLRGDPLASIASSLTTPASLPLINHLSIAAGKAAAAGISNATSNNKTRGGATKRVFKPTIPSLQPERKTRAQSQAEKKEPERRKEPGSSPRGKAAANNHQKRGRVPIEKNYVQLESNVFTGINAALSQPSGVKRSGGGSGSSSSATPAIIKSEVKVTKADSKPLKNLMKDDFIADSSDEEDSDGERKYSSVKPIGWDSLFFEDKDDKKVDSPGEPPPAAADVSASSALQDGRMLLIQLPEQMIPLTDDQLISSSGSIGKMRIYASGRVDFVDETVDENPENFTCLRADDAVTTIAIKDENGTETLIDLKVDAPSSGTMQQQHVVFYDMEEREAVSCGLLNPVDKLVLMPDVQSDVR